MNRSYISDNRNTNMYVKNKMYVSFTTIDRIADEKFSGKYNLSKSNICNECFITRYANGSCNCNS